MKKDVYTLEEMKELNIITDHYQMITAPEIVTAQLEMKAECKDKYTLRVFFSFMDGRKSSLPYFGGKVMWGCTRSLSAQFCA